MTGLPLPRQPGVRFWNEFQEHFQSHFPLTLPGGHTLTPPNRSGGSRAVAHYGGLLRRVAKEVGHEFVRREEDLGR